MYAISEPLGIKLPQTGWYTIRMNESVNQDIIPWPNT